MIASSAVRHHASSATPEFSIHPAHGLREPERAGAGGGAWRWRSEAARDGDADYGVRVRWVEGSGQGLAETSGDEGTRRLTGTQVARYEA